MKSSAATRLIKSDAGGIANISPNENRVGMLVSLDDGAAFRFIIGAADGTNKGIFVPTGQGFIALCSDDYGDAITNSFTVIANALAQANVVVTEFTKST